jgi:hypothetical protein
LHHELKLPNDDFRRAHNENRRPDDDRIVTFISPVPASASVINKTSAGGEEGYHADYK